MQNRFKFRLYDKAIGEMVYDVCVGFIKDSGLTDDWVCADTSCGQITYRDNKLKDIILMQSTGLKDKNGKLIYEGDIVQFYDDEFLQTMKIVWDDDELDFKAIGLKKNVECYGQDFSYLGCIEKEDNLEVIGNIYQDSLKEES